MEIFPGGSSFYKWLLKLICHLHHDAVKNDRKRNTKDCAHIRRLKQRNIDQESFVKPCMYVLFIVASFCFNMQHLLYIIHVWIAHNPTPSLYASEMLK